MNIPEVTFKCRILNEENEYQWKNVTTQDFFLNKNNLRKTPGCIETSEDKKKFFV